MLSYHSFFIFFGLETKEISLYVASDAEWCNLNIDDRHINYKDKKHGSIYVLK